MAQNFTGECKADRSDLVLKEECPLFFFSLKKTDAGKMCWQKSGGSASLLRASVVYETFQGRFTSLTSRYV
jgi:hypothetical protein